MEGYKTAHLCFLRLLPQKDARKLLLHYVRKDDQQRRLIQDGETRTFRDSLISVSLVSSEVAWQAVRSHCQIRQFRDKCKRYGLKRHASKVWLLFKTNLNSSANSIRTSQKLLQTFVGNILVYYATEKLGPWCNEHQKIPVDKLGYYL